ncbi:NifB/NifX family molybdenum-iron cluster-binding protein [bacterium]|nr:NifB/NifX family molybdenum-iron cluster-binding protein [bacterium]MBU1636995.1 NifB/NifX family molybdenum-iron cluster-binding protein [bacterium]MBU1919958.1 NifB/NifX family molybdenum-iron cluster-binding protein [bacterium]RQV97741.1 MAG: dinitrogenase iron-molybdenum cofactor biosynthesis protein [bacterium]
MKIAFTTQGQTLEAALDSRFGRAPNFIIYDLDSNTFKVIDNRDNLNAAQGAGVQSAETIAKSGATVLVTGHCGPNAYRVLQSAGIKIYNCDAPTVKAALELYRTGKLAESSAADVTGHWK